MDFGIMLTPHWPDGLAQERVYHQAVDCMVEAERLGYRSGWTTEHHFASDPDYRPLGLEEKFPAYDLNVDPLTFLAYVAAKTTRLRLGTGVLVLHYDNPVRVAERAAMLDVMSGGRLELGVGRGGGHKEPAVFNVPSEASENQDKFFEALDILRSAWTGRPFSYQGKYYEVPEVTVIPRPLQQPLPVFLSNRNPRSLTYAADHGMSYVAVTASWGASGVPRHNEGHDLFVNTARASGRSVQDVLYPHTLFCYCAPTDREAEEVAEEYLLKFAAFSESHYETLRMAGNVSSPLAPAPAAGSKERRAQFEAQLETNLIGSPETICEKLAAVREKIDSLNYVLAIVGAGAPPEDFVFRSMRLFAEKVAPRFSGTAARRATPAVASAIS